MSLEAQDKRALSDIRMARAYEFLDDGKANYKDKRYKTSVLTPETPFASEKKQ
ncbi:MAG: hypothetical protein AB1711_00750 [Thermodesulfobacteriota bacterium]